MSPKLFSSTYNEHAEDFKKQLPVNINLRFETVSSHIALCEEIYVLPLLGEAMFTRMTSYLETDPTLATACADSTLIDKVRFALIRLAIWKGYDVIAATISDTGVSAEVDKENRLYRYQEENVKRTLKEEGFNYLDSVLEYVEANADTFTEYESREDPRLVPSTRVFDSCYSIGGSRLVFLKMKPYIRDVELIQLQHRIGKDFYEELLVCDESQAAYSSILPYIRNYVVYMAVAEGIGELHKMPTEKGLLFESASMDGVSESPVSRAQMAETRERFAQKAERYLSAALDIVKSAPEMYPNYAGFAGDSPIDGVFRRDNTDKKTFLA